MTNTIPNVPLELKPCPFCGSEAGRATKKATWNLSRHRVACTNSGCGAHYGYWHPIEWNTRAPSPAGVDEDDEYMPDGIVQGIMQSEEVDAVSLAAKSLKAAGVDGWDVAGDILVKLSAAQLEIDQQAQRIGELEGLLRDFAYHTQRREMPTESSLAEWADRIDAAPAAPAADAGLVEALEKLARLGNGDKYGNSDGNFIAQAALAAHSAKGVV